MISPISFLFFFLRIRSFVSDKSGYKSHQKPGVSVPERSACSQTGFGIGTQAELDLTVNFTLNAEIFF